MIGSDTELGIIAFWPFANSVLLWWGLVALLPVLLQFWNRRRYVETPWAAMEFLMAAVRQHARRLRLENLLLLAVRMAIPILLALAIANPMLNWSPTGTAGLTRSGVAHTVIVIDGSYSMDWRHGTESGFERAKKLAAKLVENGQQGDGYTLVCMGQPPQVVIGEVAFDPGDVRRELERLPRTDGGADLIATCAQVESLVSRARRRFPRLVQQRVCILTDLGRNTWDAATTAAGRAVLKRLGSLATLQLVDVGPGDQGNCAVVGLSVRPAATTVVQPVTISVQLESFGSAPTQETPVDLLIDGQQVATESVRFNGGGQAAVSFRHRFRMPGSHVLAARLDSDALPADNARWLSLNVRSALRVLCIEGRPEAARNVALALQPGRAATAPIQPVIRSESALLDADLGQYDALCLCNIGRFGRRQMERVAAYVRSGGGLIWWLGDQVDAANYNRVLSGPPIEDSLLRVRLLGPAPSGDYHFDPLDYRHPVTQPFRANENAGLLTTPVWKFIGVAPIESTPVTTVLAFDTGDPAILQWQLGQGRVILITTAGSTQSVDHTQVPPTPWSALPVWPSFPPLVQEMVKEVLAGVTLRRNVLVGTPFQVMVPDDAGAASATIIDPAGVRQRLALRTEAERVVGYFAQTQHAGVYSVAVGDDDSSQEHFAVNLDTRESTTERIESTQLPAVLHGAERHVAAATDGSAAPVASRRTAGIFRGLLAGVFGLLLLETLLAWFFGKEAYSDNDQG